ncbi:MAG: hypothetical protein PHR28_00145 [candidate division Zixibacteria bacterium]|nr:hypothetical protein [candidate division Zixibacteria bacterium]
MTINLYAAWVAFLLGSLAGAITGLFFHGEIWLGGYGSWRRRMTRLGHIAFFGLGLINLAFALTINVFHIESEVTLPSILLVIGAATMPLVCYLSAFKASFRHLFFIPALATIGGIAAFLWRILLL